MGPGPALFFKTVLKDIVDVFPDMQHNWNEMLLASDDTNRVACKQLLTSLCKKWVPSSGTPELKKSAIDTFINCNDICRSWQPTTQSFHSRVLDEMKNLAFKQFDRVEISWTSVFDHARMGPGASVSSRGKNSSFEKLFLNRMSTTSVPLYKEYLTYVQSYPTWHNAEKQRQALLGRRALRIVNGSTLSTVRKNLRTDRVIGTQPSLNMFAQLGVGGIIDDVLMREYGYDPAVQQDRNRELARRGSRSGSIATIDMTTSSDLIAKKLVEWYSHPLLYAVLCDTRSDYVKIGRNYVEKHMISSMGNGFTFPLMTHLYSLVLEATCRVLGEKFVRFDQPGSPFGVFGDDVICPSRLYAPVMGVLASLGFIPNLEKSYSTGDFRESCGADCHRGHNVRGVYIKKLESVQDAYSAINRLNLWSSRHKVPLRRTIRLLLPRGWKRHTIPTDEGLDTGIMCPLLEYRSEYKCYEPVVKRDQVYKFRRGKIVGFRRQYNNPFGLLLSTINGSVRFGCISRRQTDNAYALVTKSVPPYWARSIDLSTHGVTLCDWEVLTSINLNL